jgi:SseB protein N-terminal domain
MPSPVTDRLLEALGVWTAAPTPSAEAGVFSALLEEPVLVPVRATVVSEQSAPMTGMRGEKEAELSLLTVSLDGGRQVLPVFSTPAAMRRWAIEARPVQVPVREACRAALDEGWTGVVVDPGSHDFVIDQAVLLALADGFAPVGGRQSMSVGQVDVAELLPIAPVSAPAQLTAALRRAIAREPAVAAAWLLQVAPGLQVGLVLRTPLDGAGLATVSARLEGRLAGLLSGRPFSVAALDPDTAAAAAQRCLQLWP